MEWSMRKQHANLKFNYKDRERMHFDSESSFNCNGTLTKTHTDCLTKNINLVKCLVKLVEPKKRFRY